MESIQPEANKQNEKKSEPAHNHVRKIKKEVLFIKIHRKTQIAMSFIKGFLTLKLSLSSLIEQGQFRQIDKPGTVRQSI